MTKNKSFILCKSKKMNHESAFKSNTELIKKYGIGNAHLIWVMGLYLDYPNLDELASECLTDGNNDKKIDFIKLDIDNKKIVFAQGYYSERKAEAAKANKASDLNTAAAWLLSGDPDQTPEQLREIIKECRQAIAIGDIEQIDLLYVHNLPESIGVTRELKTAADHMAAALATINSIAVIYKELGIATTEELYTEQSSEIIIKNEITCPAPIKFEEKGPKWEAAILTIPASWMRAQFLSYGDKLFSANYRGFLGVSKRRKINSGIKSTAENKAQNFWAYNNGITILTLGFSPGKNASTTILNGMSIINGAQTTGSLGSIETNADLSNVYVLARVIKCTDPDTIQDIVKYNNTQNKITTWDKFSNDSIQKTIQEQFDVLGHRYNLKRGFSNDGEIGIENVAQPLVALLGNYVAANQGKNEIFDSDPLYKVAFEHAKSRHILLAYCISRAFDTIRFGLKEKKANNKTIALEEKQLILLRNLRFKYFFMAVFGACLETLLGQRVNIIEVGYSPDAAKRPLNELIVEIEAIVNTVLIYTTTTINGTEFSDILDESNPLERISRQVSGILLATLSTNPSPALDNFKKIVSPQ